MSDISGLGTDKISRSLYHWIAKISNFCRTLSVFSILSITYILALWKHVTTILLNETITLFVIFVFPFFISMSLWSVSMQKSANKSYWKFKAASYPRSS